MGAKAWRWCVLECTRNVAALWLRGTTRPLCSCLHLPLNTTPLRTANLTSWRMDTPNLTLERNYTLNITPRRMYTPDRLCSSVVTSWRTGLPAITQRTTTTTHSLSITPMRTYSVDSGGATERLAPVINISERTAKLVAVLEAKKGAKFSEQRVSLLYHHLLDLGVKPRTIEAQLQEMPDLLHHPLDKWRDTSTAMVGCGLTGLTVLQNIATAPRLLQMKSRELSNTLMKLHNIHFGKHNLLTLASSHPALYFVPPTTLKKRITVLHGMFPTADLATFLRNNPNVLTEDLKTLMVKIMYIHKVMGLEQPHMASCQGLTHSLLHIKTRHQFLYRSGVYKTPNLLRDYRSDKRNPRLSDILDSSDRFFANKVARLTDEEYTTFKAMMVEEEEEEENELDSYSSSDEEEELF